MSTELVTTNSNELSTTSSAFDAIVGVVCKSVSATSARAYASDLAAWRAWADDNQQSADMPHVASVSAYIEALAAAGASRAKINRAVSAVRKLAKVGTMIDFDNPQRKAAAESLSLVTVRAGVKEAREKHALSPAQADRAMRAWAGDSLRDMRNRALVAAALATGARRAELAALKWADVDLENGVIHIASGKGDKARDAAICGDFAIDALAAWRVAQGGDRTFVFCGMRRGDNLDKDAPMSGQAIADVFSETSERTGDDMRPHDARRTLATEALRAGASVADVQAQLGHARADTTLRYAAPVDAAARRDSLKLRYG